MLLAQLLLEACSETADGAIETGEEACPHRKLPYP